MLEQKIPCTVITGFLGAGKTTLIRNLLATADGKRIALIINEFGDLGVDGEVLKGCGEETCTEDDIVELTNGCICCTVADDFIPTISALLERDQQPDHIVIETSGLALPQPLVDAFNWPEIKPRVTVDGVVTVVDSAAVAAGRFAHDEHAVAEQRAEDETLDHESPLEELFEDQIRCADLIVLNKTDLVGQGDMSKVRHAVEHEANGNMKLIEAKEGKLPASLLIGLGVGSEDDLANRRSHHEQHHHDHHHDDDHHDDHHHHHDHDHDQFDSFVVELGAVGDANGFAESLADVIRTHDILRLKGFAAVEGKPMRLSIQAVGARVDTYFDQPWGTDAPSTRLVVIGLAGLDQAAIAEAIKG